MDPAKDYIILLGDMNEQLQGNVQDRTGKWVGGAASKNANKIMDVMHMFDLNAVNTQFEPKRGQSVHTYLCPASKKTTDGEDFDMYVGESVASRYKGKLVHGRVTSVNHPHSEDEKELESDLTWTVQYEDNYKRTYDKADTSGIILPATSSGFRRFLIVVDDTTPRFSRSRL